MAPGGTVVLVGAGTASSLAIVVQALAVPLRSRLRGQRMVSFLASITREDLLILGELAAAGKIAPVIDRTYPLREAAEAVRVRRDRPGARQGRHHGLSGRNH